MNTPRYIEIFKETVENGKSVLRYHGYDGKMHTIGSGDVQALADCIASTAFVNGAPSFDGKTRHEITMTLTRATSDSKLARVADGSPYVAHFVSSAYADYPSFSYSVTMGGDTITDDVTELKTITETVGGVSTTYKQLNVNIPSVTGAVVVTVTCAAASPT